MANTMDLGSETLRRLTRQGLLIEAGQYLREQLPKLMREEEFGEALTDSFIPALVRAADQEMRTVADAICVAWLVADGLKHFPDEPWLGAFRRLVLPATDWAKGWEAAVTLATKRSDLPFSTEYRSRGAPRRPTQEQTSSVVRLERRVAVTEYRMGKWESSASGSARRTLLRSTQEREFMKAARAYFVGREVLPNIPIRNFIDIDRLAPELPSEVRRYAQLAEADVLVATPVDFDPVGVIELDSGYHDLPVAQLRDSMKERLLQLAGIPLVRLRAESAAGIHAADFYNLLQDQWQKFEAFRLSGWRERDQHARMLPAA